MSVVVSDRDQRLAVAGHVVRLKKGKNEVPEGLVEHLASFAGVTNPNAKAEPKSDAK